MPSSPKTPVNTALAAPRVRSITLLQPLQWLALGWRDMAHCGWISFAHGLVLALLGWAILLLAHDRVWLLAGAFSGFLVIAPALAARGWMLTSAAFVTLFTPVPVNSPLEFVRHVMLAEDGFVFELWLGLGGLLAAPMFASSSVAIPLLLGIK